MLAARGPVCVLAGAGTGKTRTITRRIAHLVTAGHVAAGQVLAVTFTQRAAGEMRSRLRALDDGAGTGSVQAMTFHAAARRQLHYFWPRVVGDTGWQLLDSKFSVVAQAASRAGLHVSTDDVRDLAGEIEWAKASLISPEDYATAVAEAGRDIPLDAAKVSGVYAGYETAKARADGMALLDFDDLLLHTAAAIENDAAVAERVPRPLPLLRRRRVPGRHPAPAASPRRLAGRARRPDRRRRRQPDHLFVHRRQPALSAEFLAALSRRRGGAAGARLSVDATGGVTGQPGDRRRPRPGGGKQAAPCRPARPGAQTVVRRASRRGRRGDGGREEDRAAHRERYAAVGDRGAVPDQRPVGGV